LMSFETAVNFAHLEFVNAVMNTFYSQKCRNRNRQTERYIGLHYTITLSELKNENKAVIIVCNNNR